MSSPPIQDEENLKAIQCTCQKCGWIYSSRNTYCPMCGAPINLSEKDLVRAFLKYGEIMGTKINSDDALGFLIAFKKAHKRDVTLEDLWGAAKQLVKMQEKSAEAQKQAQKEAKGKVEVKTQMDKMKQEKEKELSAQRKKELEELRKKEAEDAKRKAEEERRKQEEAQEKAKAKSSVLQCPTCGASNPGSSKFCMECGTRFLPSM